MVKEERCTVLGPQEAGSGLESSVQGARGGGLSGTFVGREESRIGQREVLNCSAACGDPKGCGWPYGEMSLSEAGSLGLCTLGIIQYQRAGVTWEKQASGNGHSCELPATTVPGMPLGCE